MFPKASTDNLELWLAKNEARQAVIREILIAGIKAGAKNPAIKQYSTKGSFPFQKHPEVAIKNNTGRPLFLLPRRPELGAHAYLQLSESSNSMVLGF